ncbi:MAG: DNA polymerase III subunit beta [Desulfobulbaceae bacterium A2]|nr:MAG: DNA polymerase III subunit beta [Desulfobulbaceae bacterium A2]
MPLEFSISRLDLLQVMASQQQVSKKSSMPILANVLINVDNSMVALSTTDMEVALRQSLVADVEHEGSLTLPAKKLYELARESASERMIFREKEKFWVEITAGSSTYRLSGISAEDFPDFPDFNVENLVEISAAVLVDSIDKVLFSIATEKENIPSLTNALLRLEEVGEKCFLRLVSSDAHRMTFMTREVPLAVSKLAIKPNTLIPRKGLVEIRRFCENLDTVFVGVEEKQLVLNFKDDVLVVRLSEGVFPDSNAIAQMAENEFNIIIPRLDFLDALKRIDLFSEDIFHAIRIDITKEKIVLRSRNSDYGSADDEIPTEYEGEDVSIAFNCRYLIETLQVMNGSEIRINFSSNEEKPCKIVSNEDIGFLSIIMPMKI